MLIERTNSLYNLTITKHEAVELIKKLAERTITNFHADVFNMTVSDITEGQAHQSGVLRIEVIK